jgi:hypothetical protein
MGRKGSWTLMGIILVVALLVAAGAFYLSRPWTGSVKSDNKLLDQQSRKSTVVGKAIDTAKGVDCQERLRQIRAAIVTYKASDPNEANPPTLEELRLGVSADYFQCPVSKQPYIYNPADGSVRCQYQSHATY